VESKLLDRQADESSGPHVTCRGRREDCRCELRQISGTRCCRPRYQILNRIDFRRSQNCTRQRCRGLPSVGCGGDDVQRPPSDPGASAFIAEYRTPTTAPRVRAVHASRVCNGPGARDENDSWAFAKRVIEGNPGVGINNDIIGHIASFELALQRTTLLFATDSRESRVQHRGHRSAVTRFRKRLLHERSNHVRRPEGFAGPNR